MVLEFKKVVRKGLLLETNLTVDEGKLVMILSENINNASDILKMIFDLKKPSSGKIIIFSKESKREINKLKSSMAFISPLRIKKATGTAYSFLLRSASFYKADYKEDINNYLQLFNLNPDKKISDMNKYERNNLSIINSLFYSPSLILINNILDELDDKSRIIFDNILYKFKKRGATIICASTRCNLNNIDDIYYYKENQLFQNNELASYNKIIIKGKYNKEDDPNICKIENDNITSIIVKNDMIKKISSTNEVVEVNKPYIGELLNL